MPVPIAPNRLGALDATSLLAAFAEIYRAKYGYYYDDVPAELVNILVAGHAGEAPEIIAPLPEAGDIAPTPRGRHRAWSPRRGELIDFVIYDRDAFAPGMAFAGPALIEEASATTVVDIDASVGVDRFGSLAITLPEEPR